MIVLIEIGIQSSHPAFLAKLAVSQAFLCPKVSALRRGEKAFSKRDVYSTSHFKNMQPLCIFSDFISTKNLI